MAAAGGRRAPAKPTAPSGSSAAALGTSCTTTMSTASGRPASNGDATWTAAVNGRIAGAWRPSGPSVRASVGESRLQESTPWCGPRGRGPLQTGISLCRRMRKTSDKRPCTASSGLFKVNSSADTGGAYLWISKLHLLGSQVVRFRFLRNAHSYRTHHLA